MLSAFVCNGDGDRTCVFLFIIILLWNLLVDSEKKLFKVSAINRMKCREKKPTINKIFYCWSSCYGSTPKCGIKFIRRKILRRIRCKTGNKDDRSSWLDTIFLSLSLSSRMWYSRILFSFSFSIRFIAVVFSWLHASTVHKSIFGKHWMLLGIFRESVRRNPKKSRRNAKFTW